MTETKRDELSDALNDTAEEYLARFCWHGEALASADALLVVGTLKILSAIIGDPKRRGDVLEFALFVHHFAARSLGIEKQPS